MPGDKRIKKEKCWRQEEEHGNYKSANPVRILIIGRINQKQKKKHCCPLNSGKLRTFYNLYLTGSER